VHEAVLSVALAQLELMLLAGTRAVVMYGVLPWLGKMRCVKTRMYLVLVDVCRATPAQALTGMFS